jgi:hypothetical protein
MPTTGALPDHLAQLVTTVLTEFPVTLVLQACLVCLAPIRQSR